MEGAMIQIKNRAVIGMATGTSLLLAVFLLAIGDASGSGPKQLSCSRAALQAALNSGGSYALPGSCTIYMTSQPLQMSAGSTTIAGGVLDGRVGGPSASTQSRIFNVTGGELTLESVTIQYGQTEIKTAQPGAKGATGQTGADGATGATPSGDGMPGLASTPGTDGKPGTAPVPQQPFGSPAVVRGGCMAIASGATVHLLGGSIVGCTASGSGLDGGTDQNGGIGGDGGWGGNGGDGAYGNNGGSPGGGNGGNGAPGSEAGNGGDGQDGLTAEGGGVYNGGTLTIDNVTFVNDAAYGGNAGWGGEGGSGGWGGNGGNGGLGNPNGNGGNGASGGGSGNGGNGGNGADGLGGAIYNTGSLTVTSTTFRGNAVQSGAQGRRGGPGTPGPGGEGGQGGCYANGPPCGSNGSAGASGQSGKSGTDGTDGTAHGGAIFTSDQISVGHDSFESNSAYGSPTASGNDIYGGVCEARSGAKDRAHATTALLMYLDGKAITKPQEKVVIGQPIDLSVKACFVQWSVQGWAADLKHTSVVENYRVQDSGPSSYGRPVALPDPSGEKSAKLSFEFIRGSSFTVSASTSSGTARVTFEVIRPSVGSQDPATVCDVAANNTVSEHNETGTVSPPTLGMGLNDWCEHRYGIVWHWMVTAPKGAVGELAMVQLITRNEYTSAGDCPEGDQPEYEADASSFYPNLAGQPTTVLGRTGSFEGRDAPYITLYTHSWVYHLSFFARDYLMYRSKIDGSIWIPIGEVTWHFIASAAADSENRWLAAVHAQPHPVYAPTVIAPLPQWDKAWQPPPRCTKVGG
jgi:hypothetical protein